MTFDELKNGMKSLFSSLGAKTSDSNYAVGLFDKTSAEPKGLMGMSDLASVLGDGTVLTTSDNVLNLGTGEYVSYAWAVPQGLPDGVIKTGFVSVTVFKNSNKKRVIYRPTQGDKTYWNLYWDNAWTGWTEM